MERCKNARCKKPKGPFSMVRRISYVQDREGASFSFEQRTQEITLVRSPKEQFVRVTEYACTAEENGRPVSCCTRTDYRVAADADGITADNWEKMVIKPCAHVERRSCEGVVAPAAMFVSAQADTPWKRFTSWLMVFVGGFFALDGILCLPVVFSGRDEMTFPQLLVVLAFFAAMALAGSAVFWKGIRRLPAAPKPSKAAPVKHAERAEAVAPTKVSETPKTGSEPSVPVRFDGTTIHICSKAVLEVLSDGYLNKPHEFPAVLPLAFPLKRTPHYLAMSMPAVMIHGFLLPLYYRMVRC